MKLGSFDAAWCTEHSGIISVTISQILMTLHDLVTFDKLQLDEGKWPDVGQYIHSSIQLLAIFIQLFG